LNPATVDFLIENGIVSAADIEEARLFQGHGGSTFAGALIRLGALSDEVLADALAAATGLPLLHSPPSPEQVSAAQARLHFSLAWLQEQEILVWLDAEDEPCIAVASELNQAIIESAEHWCVLPDRRFVAPYWTMRALLSDLDDTLARGGEDQAGVRLGSLVELAEDAPAIEFINTMLAEALASRASDIHIEPFKGAMQIRLRIDGTLQTWRTVHSGRFAPVASRLKLLSGMDIAERRMPQDGRQTARIAGREVEIRVSCLPGVWGESIVLRFLGRTVDLPSLADLGLDTVMADSLQRLARQPAGLLLVAGPTGSGKTTTVYKLLEGLNDGTRKIITMEDPVEIDLPGAIQVNVRPDIGLEFATGLRAMLRQDPDIIFVGEIRDAETARMATRAALTGHLVISTVHTASATASVARMLDLGVEGYLLADALIGVVSQRLLRRRAAEGGQRYQGRIGVYELLEVNAAMRDAIRANRGQTELEDAARRAGFRSMRDDARVKILAGFTDEDEMGRVLGA
jgi:general secretion pathway protein E